MKGEDMRSASVSYALTSVQQGMLFNRVRAPGSGVDIEQMIATLLGRTDANRLKRAWEVVAGHHDVLRARLKWDGVGTPHWEELASIELSFEEQDLTAL